MKSLSEGVSSSWDSSKFPTRAMASMIELFFLKLWQRRVVWSIHTPKTDTQFLQDVSAPRGFITSESPVSDLCNCNFFLDNQDTTRDKPGKTDSLRPQSIRDPEDEYIKCKSFFICIIILFLKLVDSLDQTLDFSTEAMKRVKCRVRYTHTQIYK